MSVLKRDGGRDGGREENEINAINGEVYIS